MPRSLSQTTNCSRVLDDVDVRRDSDRPVVDLGEVARRAALELLDLLDGLVNLLDRHLHLPGDRLVVVLLELWQMLVDDVDLDVVVAVSPRPGSAGTREDRAPPRRADRSSGSSRARTAHRPGRAQLLPRGLRSSGPGCASRQAAPRLRGRGTRSRRGCRSRARRTVARRR